MKFPFVLRSTYEALLEDSNYTYAAYNEARKEIKRLRDQLKEASKNDHRDPKGRFTKAD